MGLATRGPGSASAFLQLRPHLRLSSLLPELLVLGARGNLLLASDEDNEERSILLDHQCCACLVLLAPQ